MRDQVADLALHAHTGLPLAYATTQSEARDFFESRPFGHYRKGLEAKQKLHSAYLGRLDGMLTAFGRLGKSLGRRR